jgi:predicted ATPase
VLDACLEDVALYAPHEPALRGLTNESKREPIGVHGEDLDMAFSQLSEDIQDKLIGKLSVIPWFDNLEFDERDEGKFKGLKPGRSFSKLYFDDQFMVEGNRRFSAENVNEGILFLLFYMVLFAHPQTPKMLLVDNIEAALNPRLCRSLSKMLAEMAKEHDKQAIVTTHNPAVLDGINLNDPDQRLFVVYRDNDGHTKLERIAEKPKVEVTQRTLKLSEMWMSGLLGGVPNQF